MLLTKVFGFLIAAGVLGTSIAMLVMGGRFQKIESAAYAGEKRPAWFWLISTFVMALYLAALYSFIIAADKTWAGWILVVLMPIGWVVKGGLVIFNKKGRQAVSAISGDESWQKVALARLPIVVILSVLAIFA